MIKLLLFFLAAAWMASGNHSGTGTANGDTTWVNVYVLTVTPDELQRINDTVNIIMHDYGIELTGSAIRANQEAIGRQFNKLTSRLRLDSVAVVKGGKP